MGSGWTFRLSALAFTAAVGVSVIYLPQALLLSMSRDLSVSIGAADAVATTVQFGYALGIFFLVPLSDRVRPRRQITVQLVLLTLTMTTAAAFPGIVGVTLAFLGVGFVANVAQLIIPAASRLAPGPRAGATTGVLVGAVGVGIFGGRVVAGLVVGTIGWRWTVIVFAILVLATVPLVRRALPAVPAPPPAPSGYAALLISTIGRFRSGPAVTRSSVLQFLVFATFNSLWTVSGLFLTGPRVGWTPEQAGLLGLVGLVAALLTPAFAPLVRRLGTTAGIGVSLGVLLAATALVVVAPTAWSFGLSVFCVTLANQTIQAANQHRVVAENPGAPAQANTAFMMSVFLGGSLGAFLGPTAFSLGGMPLVGSQAAVLVTIAFIAWTAFWPGHVLLSRTADAR